MKIRVKLFAAARDLAGGDEVSVEVKPVATLADVHTALLDDIPALAKIAACSVWAVDTQYAPQDTRITERSEIALIPPVSGG